MKCNSMSNAKAQHKKVLSASITVAFSATADPNLHDDQSQTTTCTQHSKRVMRYTHIRMAFNTNSLQTAQLTAYNLHSIISQLASTTNAGEWT